MLHKRSKELQDRSATEENTLLIDDTPSTNVLNNPYIVVQPTTRTKFTERKVKAGVKLFVNQVLQSFLFKLTTSGCIVPEFCKSHESIGKPRMLPSHLVYNQHRDLVLYATL